MQRRKTDEKTTFAKNFFATSAIFSRRSPLPERSFFSFKNLKNVSVGRETDAKTSDDREKTASRPLKEAQTAAATVFAKANRFSYFADALKTSNFTNVFKPTHSLYFSRFIKIARSFALLGIVATIGASTIGCNAVRRRLTITSEPSGAVVYLNNKEIGKTPISQNFVYSGTYKIRCYKEGYEANETTCRVGTPWYLYPGFDFFSENFVPGEIRDEQSCHITLTQKREIPENELFDAATQLRDEAHNNSSLQYYVGSGEYVAPNAAENNAANKSN